MRILRGKGAPTRAAITVLAASFACVFVAAFAVERLESRAIGARDAQSRLLSLRLDLMEARDVPWDAAPGSGVKPVDARGELQDTIGGIRSSLARLRRTSGLPNEKGVLAHFDAAATALWGIFRGVRDGNSDATNAASDTAARQIYAAVGAMGTAASVYHARSDRARTQAEQGSAAIVGALFIGFAWFYVRAVRRRVRAETLAGENERLLAERRRLFEDVVDAGEEERRRIAGELHDGPIQQLAALALTVDLAERRYERGNLAGLDEAMRTVRVKAAEQMEALRRLMVELRPPVLEQMGLEAALHDYVADLDARVAAHCEFSSDLGPRHFPHALETTFYRIVQEALRNADKHARATAIRVALTTNGGSVVHLSIEDDGVGFPEQPESDLIRGGHFGLIGLRERVERAGGTFRVTSTPGVGTTVEAVVPVAAPGA